MAYIYRHIRLDKNEPFYIGKSVDCYRPYNKKSRNDIWLDIVSKTDYEVEILISNLSDSVALEKEKEFIKLYGRIENGGILANKTDGGKGGNLGGIVSEKTRLIKSEVSKKKIITKETREKMAAKLRGRAQPDWQKAILKDSAIKRANTKRKDGDYNSKIIIQYSMNNDFIHEFSSIKSACTILGVQSSNIQKVIKGKRNHTGGFKFRLKQR